MSGGGDHDWHAPLHQHHCHHSPPIVAISIDKFNQSKALCCASLKVQIFVFVKIVTAINSKRDIIV